MVEAEAGSYTDVPLAALRIADWPRNTRKQVREYSDRGWSVTCQEWQEF